MCVCVFLFIAGLPTCCSAGVCLLLACTGLVVTPLALPIPPRHNNAKGAIVDLTAESEELEAELSQRGTLGIIKVLLF